MSNYSEAITNIMTIVKEQEEQIKQLKQENSTLTKRVTNLKAQQQAMKDTIKTYKSQLKIVFNPYPTSTIIYA